MRADFPVILDACVLANARVCDFLFRLAENPRLYLPFWSEKLLEETQRTHQQRLSWKPAISDSWREAVSAAFPDSCVENLDLYTAPQAINEKDRHVVQAALGARAEVIVTFNLKDFPSSELDALNIRAKHPAEFLLTLFSIEPLLVAKRLNEISKAKKEPFLTTLRTLRIHVPAFVDHFADSIAIDLDEDAG